MHQSVRLFARSAWKGPHFVVFPNLQESIARNIPIYTMARSCTVLPNFIGAKFMIHNGKTYNPVTITQEMVGYKLGEFAPTRKPFSYKPSQKGK
ncbi:putative mitochondrial ribosomal protein S19 [Serendipita vermifera]|nr:putative mitochondrial ribosomal protein S19 [Serendipita vermifera]